MFYKSIENLTSVEHKEQFFSCYYYRKGAEKVIRLAATMSANGQALSGSFWEGLCLRQADLDAENQSVMLVTTMPLAYFHAHTLLNLRDLRQVQETYTEYSLGK